MKNSSILWIIAIIAIGTAAFFLGRWQRPTADIQSEISGIRSLAISQEQTLDEMDSILLSYRDSVSIFFRDFSEFRKENSESIKKLQNLTSSGRAFQQKVLDEISELDKERGELSEEANKFDL